MAYKRGVNDSGAEFGTNIPGVYNVDYHYDSAATYTYLASRGMQVVRLPFKWERIQPTRNAALDVNELGRLTTAVSNIHAAGMQAILDVHNYARYHSGGVDLVLGTDFTVGDLSDLWTRLSTAFKGNAGIYAYGLMNEPHDLASIPGVFTNVATLFDFESGTQSWNPEGTATLAQSATQVHDGSHSLAITQTLAGSGSDHIRANVSDSTAEGGHNAISAWAWIPATAPGNWSAFLQIQDSSFTYQSGASFALTKGAWTQIPSTFADAIWTGHHAYAVQFQTDAANGTSITVYLDTFQHGDLSATTTGAQVWQNDSQTILNAIRANADTTLVLVPGYSFSGAQNWTTNHPTPWITDSANNFLYEAHYYFDTGNAGTYPNSYATETTNAISGGYASLGMRARAEMNVFLNWLASNNVGGFVGEMGWPHGTDAVSFNAVGGAVYALLDKAGVGATYWTTGEWYNNTYPLSVYDNSGGSGHIDTAQAQASIIESHLGASVTGLVTADHQRFYHAGHELRFVGVNSYDLGVVGNNSPSQQLARLQELKNTYGVNVVRTWAFGEANNASPQSGYLQYGTIGGLWNEAAFVVLDNAVAAAKSLGMLLILTLVDNYTSYGGKNQYVAYYNTRNSLSLPTNPGDNFHDTAGLIAMFEAFILKLLSRTNTVTGVAYKDEPAIMAWEVINEGRYTTITDTNQNTTSSARLTAMTSWYSTIASFIRSIDPHHLVGSGSISQYYDWQSGDPMHNGTYYGLDYQIQHQYFDYYDMHFYPWNGFNTSPADMTFKWVSAAAYHAQLAQMIQQAHTPNPGYAMKPVVIGEFGLDKRNAQTTPLLAYPRVTFFQQLFAEFFDTDGGDGLLIWNANNDSFPDNNYGLTNNVAATDTNITSLAPLNITDNTLLAAINARNLSLTQGDIGMAALTASDVQTSFADPVAKHIILQQAIPGSTSTLVAAQATTLGHVAALNDAGKIYSTMDAMQACIAAENTWITNETAYNSMLDCWFTVCAALDQATGGLAAFLAANQVQVDPHFLDAFNRAVTRAALFPGKPLGNWQAFGPVVSNMGQANVTGSGAATFVAGFNIPAAYGNAPLSVQVINGTTGAASGTYTVTYNAYNSAGVLQTGLTATATIPNGSVVGTTVALSGSAAGVAVTNITLTGGTNGDKVVVVSSLLRAVAA